MICGAGFYYDRVGVDQQPWQGLLHYCMSIIKGQGRWQHQRLTTEPVEILAVLTCT